MTSSFEALRIYLDGENAFREGRYPAAWEAYERAYIIDPAFWLAYRRYRTARSWLSRGVEPPYTEEWWNHIDEFPRLERELLEADRTRPTSDRVAALRRLTQRHPDYYPGWWRYGDGIFHTFHHRLGEPLSEVIRSFERILELNPNMISVWEHLLFCYSTDGDLEKLEWALEELERRGGKEAVLEGYGINVPSLYRQILAWRQGEKTLEAAADSMALLVRESHPEAPLLLWVWSLFFSLQGHAPLQIEMNQRVLEDPGPAVPEQTLFAEAMAWASRGAWDSTVAKMDQVVSASPEPWEEYRHAALSLGAVLGALDPEEARARRPALDPEEATPESVARLIWFDGILGYASGDLQVVSDARSRLADLDTATTELVDRSLEVFELDLVGNRAEALDRLVRLEEARPDSSLGTTPLMVYGVHRLAVARWLLEAGDLDRAARFLRFHRGWPAAEGIFLSAILGSTYAYLEMGRVAEARGLEDEAVKYYREFLRRYDMPPPQHMPLVEEAQAAVERLGGGR
jgi:tetratricopeptide (TPR) repeat protein